MKHTAASAKRFVASSDVTTTDRKRLLQQLQSGEDPDTVVREVVRFSKKLPVQNKRQAKIMF